MDHLSIHPIIICGGSGSRLWPLSRESFPKQYLNLVGDGKNSLLQETYLRIKLLKNIKSPILICNEQHRFIVAEQMREIGIKPKAIILEPVGRNTAPAIALAAIRSKLENTDSVMLVLAADHIIQKKKKFLDALEAGYKTASAGKLVTFGIVPNSPNTGYGYIESKEPLTEDLQPIPIVKFLEKPNSKLAKELILDKKFTWNSGIFMFKSSKIIEEYERFAPRILNLCSNSFESAEKDLDFHRLDKKSFLKCPEISFDKAIMEKTNLGIVLPLDAGWSDVGSWQTLWEKDKKDEKGNVIKGNVIAENVKNSYLRSENRLIACLGVENLIIVENSDSILVANKLHTQKVKSIVQLLNKKGLAEGKFHNKVYRPWGNYISIAYDQKWQVKKIEVKAGASLSLQMHNHRSEHWVVVSGTAKIEIGELEKIIGPNESVYIPLGVKHRLSNPSKLPLTLIEIQSGNYLGEDDIKRFEDKYGR